MLITNFFRRRLFAPAPIASIKNTSAESSRDFFRTPSQKFFAPARDTPAHRRRASSQRMIRALHMLINSHRLHRIVQRAVEIIFVLTDERKHVQHVGDHRLRIFPMLVQNFHRKVGVFERLVGLTADETTSRIILVEPHQLIGIDRMCLAKTKRLVVKHLRMFEIRRRPIKTRHVDVVEKQLDALAAQKFFRQRQRRPFVIDRMIDANKKQCLYFHSSLITRK